ncbi:MAG: NAD(P)-dependent oxidoreductase [Calditrichaceae bacterium]
MDVIFYEAFEEEAEAIKQYLNPDIKAGFTWKTIQEYGQNMPAAPIISIRTQSIIPVSWATLLKGILSRSTGYDHLTDYKIKSETSADCGYLPLYCNRAVAEQAMLLWMSLLRKLPLQIRQFKSFHRDGLTGYECEKKTLLVVGVGNIGHEVARIGRGLGMNVLGVDIVKKHNDISYVEIRDGIANADVIVSAMNLTDQNRAYFNYSLMKKSKPGVIFVNIARGELSPAGDLIRLMDENHLGGLALDVYNHESALAFTLRNKKKSDNPEVKAILDLANFENVILTPHNAFNTEESVDRKAEQSIRQIESYIKDGRFLWPIPSSPGK